MKVEADDAAQTVAAAVERVVSSGCGVAMCGWLGRWRRCDGRRGAGELGSTVEVVYRRLTVSGAPL